MLQKWAGILIEVSSGILRMPWKQPCLPAGAAATVLTIVHAHFGTNPAAVAMFASQLSGIPYSFTAHGSEEFEKAPLLALDEKLKRSAFAVCVSSFGKSQLMRWSSPDQWKKIEVIHSGVDASFLETPFQTPTSSPRYVCIGRFVSVKAHLILIGALSQLQQMGIHCEIVLVGDGPLRSAY